MTDPDKLAVEVEQVLRARILWVLLPARRALGIRDDRLDEIVSWAAHSVKTDVRNLLDGYEIKKVKR